MGVQPIEIIYTKRDSDWRNLFNNEHAAQNTLSESKYLVLNQIDLSSEVYNLYQGLVVIRI